MSSSAPERVENGAADQPARRNFLAWLGKFSFFAGFAGIFGATARFMLPNVLYEPATTFVIGRPEDFPPDSVTFLEAFRMFIFRRPEGLYAVSSVCTHLGCNVNWDDERIGFDCPCHGSTFDGNGGNIAGPAPRPLKWYKLALVSDNDLQVNTQQEVDKDFRLQV